jgi:hypothetical protein
LKDNNYWLGLLTHLQSPDVPYKRVECLRDLKTMYETSTIGDLYDAYQHFDFSGEAVFTCVGTSGKAPPPLPDKERLDSMFYGNGSRQGSAWNGQIGAAGSGQLPVDFAAAFSKAFGGLKQQQQVPMSDAGGAGNGAPGQQELQQQQQQPDAMAMLTAMLAAAQGVKLAKAGWSAGNGPPQQEQEQDQDANLSRGSQE